MAADRHQIANAALGLLGSQRIVSFEEGTVEADLCRLHYEVALTEMLEGHPWNFAEACELLARDTNPARPDFTYSYQRPTDMVASRYLLTSAGRRSFYPFRMAKSKLCTDELDPYLVYTYRAAEHLFTPMFTKALVFLLASNLAGPLTEVDAKVQGYLQLHERMLARARNSNAMQDSPEEFPNNSLIAWHAG